MRGNLEMIERHVTFNVLPDKTREFEELFTSKYRPAMAAMPGFVKVELLREQEYPTQYQMVIRFVSMETAAGWRSSDVHLALKPKIKALYDGSKLIVYDVVA
jgi:antibiotic biosynthesis monooxygenase (ABM) superfamily enzyme